MTIGSNDRTRDVILRFLFDLHRNARSVAKQEIGLKDLQTAMKQARGLKQPEVASNLDYLVQKNWVQRIATPRTFTTKYGTNRSADRITYKISAEGIDRMEGESEFRRISPYAGIQIDNVGGVTVVGDGNVVRTQFAGVAEQLNGLRHAINESDLPNDEKFAIATDIQTIELELARAHPDSSAIHRAWQAVKVATTGGQFVTLVAQVGASLAPLLSSLT